MEPGPGEWALLAVSLAFVAPGSVLVVGGGGGAIGGVYVLFFGACAAVAVAEIVRERRAARHLLAAIVAAGCGGRVLDSEGGTSTSGVTATTSAAATSIDDPGSPGASVGTADVGGHEDCDIWRQDCPEGQKCVPWPLAGDDAFSAAVCVPLAPEVVDTICATQPSLGGDPGAIDNCPEGTLGWTIELNIVGCLCVPQCAGSPDDPQCAPGTACNVRDGQLALCEESACDPASPNCLAGRVCGFDGADEFRCFSAGAAGHVLAPCEVADDCAPGLLCAPAERAPAWCQAGATRCCLPACSLEVQVCDVAELTCVPYFVDGAAPPGYEHVGVCGSP